jgi:predicted lysophospholipase L1 biosynthesis ABC-type transport system permease subunit
MSALLVVTIGDSTYTFVLGGTALIALSVMVLTGAGILIALGAVLASRRVPKRNTAAQVSRRSTRR